LTKFSEGKIPDNYSQFLVKDGLRGARIGVLRILSEKEADPEISRLFNQALVDMEGLGAMLVDSVKVVDFDTLSQGQRCPTFRQDLEAFFATYVKRDTLMTINDVIRIGTKYDYVRDRLESERDIEVPGNMVEGCGNAYTDLKRIAFREAIEKVMDSLGLDALVYPTWNNRPARIVDFRAEYKGDNSRIIAPHTGQPAFTVPMGFSLGNLPAGIQFLGRMYSEPTLIRLSYSYEQGTKHRKAPDLK
jgi:Asp-tRNA(Asn)/Glu-tRNA(Gln) amidotransferase A subunit family amidase